MSPLTFRYEGGHGAEPSLGPGVAEGIHQGLRLELGMTEGTGRGPRRPSGMRVGTGRFIRQLPG